MTSILQPRSVRPVIRDYGLVNGQISKWFATREERDAYARSRRNLSKWKRVDPPETR